MSPHSALSAHLDEASVRLPAGGRIYGVAATLTTVEHHSTIADTLLRLLLPDRSFLHHYDEPERRRIAIAEALAEMPLDGAIILTETTSDREQERARAQLLTELLPRLQHAEHVDHVVIESRQVGDKHDRRTRDRLRQSRRITGALRVNHVGKQGGDPLVWLPDFVIGSYLAAQYHAQLEPWKILTDAHVVDVVHRPR